MKRWRYRKVTPEMKAKMRELRRQGWSYQKIADRFGVTMSTAQYHCTDKYREQAIRRAKIQPNYPNSHSHSNPNYDRKYMRERYREDPEFRERMKAHVAKSWRKHHPKEGGPESG